MRCGCPNCGQFMVHEESGAHLCCVCPACLYRCRACLGTDSLISREEVERLKMGEPNPRTDVIEADLSQISEDEEEQAAIDELAVPENPDAETD